MRKLTGSLNSGADVECLGTGHLLEGVGGCKSGGGHTFCAPKNGEQLHNILQPFLRGHVFLCIPISFLQKRNNTEGINKSNIVYYGGITNLWNSKLVSLHLSKDIRAATLTSFIGISPSDSSWRLNQILFFSSSFSLLYLSLICSFWTFSWFKL